MIHLTTADYSVQPWANGRGQTVELWRMVRGETLLARLSMARVAEDGPFSRFPGISRNLTVIAGPGFRLRGEGLTLDCAPLAPVEFPGDLPIHAEGTIAGASDDFNVMTADTLPKPRVEVIHDATVNQGGLLAIFALTSGRVTQTDVQRHDLILTDQVAQLSGSFLVVRLFGLPSDF